MEIQSQMRSEIEEIPFAIEQLLDKSREPIKKVAQNLQNLNPTLISTIARGSSDHGATYLKYAIELVANIPVVSLSPSISSIYNVDLKLQNTACLAISQSGESPDIVQMAKSASRNGAQTFAITNNVKSELAKICNVTINIEAAKEKSVAATKTFVNSIVAGLLLLAHWRNDEKLLKALYDLPEQAEKAIACEWNILNERLENKNSLYILGRGPSLAIASEMALKFKEVCQIHAQAYSSAEVMHGPVSIVANHFPIISLISNDEAKKSTLEISEQLANKGADVFITSNKNINATQLEFVKTDHPLTQPLLYVISFYSFIEKFAISKNYDPDFPPNLQKITKTL